MGRKTHGTNRKIRVTNQVREIAALVAMNAEHDTPAAFLAGRVFGSRKITRRMWDGLRGQLGS